MLLMPLLARVQWQNRTPEAVLRSTVPEDFCLLSKAALYADRFPGWRAPLVLGSELFTDICMISNMQTMYNLPMLQPQCHAMQCCPSIDAATRVTQLIAAWSHGICACRRSNALIGRAANRSAAQGLAECAPVLCASRPAARRPACVGTAGARLVRAPPPLLAPLPGEEAWLPPSIPDVPVGQGVPQQAGDSMSAPLAATLDAPLLPMEQQGVRPVLACSCEGQDAS